MFIRNKDDKLSSCFATSNILSPVFLYSTSCNYPPRVWQMMHKVLSNGEIADISVFLSPKVVLGLITSHDTGYLNGNFHQITNLFLKVMISHILLYFYLDQFSLLHVYNTQNGRSIYFESSCQRFCVSDFASIHFSLLHKRIFLRQSTTSFQNIHILDL